MTGALIKDKSERHRRSRNAKKWERARRKRSKMTEDDIASETQRLIEEAAILAAAKGLDDQFIGRGWDKNPIEIELKTNGQFKELMPATEKTRKLKYDH